MAVKPDSFPRDMKIAVRPLARTRGLAITVVASVMPAARAARVDVMEALRSE
jgi:ABC-type lipoprotein release transport system permease subunit